MSINITKCVSTTNTTPCNRIPKYIVIHYTAGTSSKTGSAKSTALYFSKSTTKASADYIVDDGSIIQYNPDPKKYYCWAVGGSKYTSITTSEGGKYFNVGKNANCINIEMCSNKTNKIRLNATDTDWYFTDETLNNTIKLTKYLMSLYNIPIENVIMHHHVTGKICPNPFCVNENSLKNWTKFKKKLVSKDTSVKNNSSSVSSSSFKVKPLMNLNIRKTPNGKIVKTDGAKKGTIYTITKTSGSWGFLKSTVGWINISDKYVKRI